MAAEPRTYYCYCLFTEDRRQTYIGATVDPEHRLRQHNGELVGGARRTQGRPWTHACILTEIPTWTAALQLEWRWKQLGRTQCSGIRDPLRRRMASLHVLLGLDRPTSAAALYSSYPNGKGPVILWKDPVCQEEYSRMVAATTAASVSTEE